MKLPATEETRKQLMERLMERLMEQKNDLLNSSRKERTPLVGYVTKGGMVVVVGEDHPTKPEKEVPLVFVAFPDAKYPSVLSIYFAIIAALVGAAKKTVMLTATHTFQVEVGSSPNIEQMRHELSDLLQEKNPMLVPARPVLDAENRLIEFEFPPQNNYPVTFSLLRLVSCPTFETLKASLDNFGGVKLGILPE